MELNPGSMASRGTGVIGGEEWTGPTSSYGVGEHQGDRASLECSPAVPRSKRPSEEPAAPRALTGGPRSRDRATIRGPIGSEGLGFRVRPSALQREAPFIRRITGSSRSAVGARRWIGSFAPGVKACASATAAIARHRATSSPPSSSVETRSPIDALRHVGPRRPWASRTGLGLRAHSPRAGQRNS
jgi:hypothetical protein